MENIMFRILAVDDDADNLNTLKTLIQDKFPKAVVSTAQIGMLGLELAAVENPDMIFLKILMPEMDGYEVCAKLKADRKLRDVPVVFITSIKDTKRDGSGRWKAVLMRFWPDPSMRSS